MKLNKVAWDWLKFHFFTNKMDTAIVANVEFRPIGFEAYRGQNSFIIYLELGIGTLMLRFGK